ncbi:jg4626, partial [Pararge aegeria aegeria]
VIGTTDYRKPEWVTHMENLQEVLKVSHFVPTFVKPLVSQRARVEQTVIFTARYSGVPKPDIVWYKDGEVIRTNETYTIENDGETTVCKIIEVTKQSEGTYRCEAVSDVGKASTTATLRVLETKETVDKVTTKKTKIVKKDQRREFVEELSISATEEVPKEVVEEEAPVEEDRVGQELEEEKVGIVMTKKTIVKKDLRKEKVKEVVEDISISAPEEDIIAPVDESPVEESKVDWVEPELVDEETVEKVTTKKSRIIKKDQRKQKVREDVLTSTAEELIVPMEITDEEAPVEEELVEEETIDTAAVKKTKVKKDLRKEKLKKVVEDISVSEVEEVIVPQEVTEEKAPVEESKVDRVEAELIKEETVDIVTTKKTKVKKDVRKEKVKEVIEDVVISATEEVTEKKVPIEEKKADGLEAAPMDETTDTFEKVPYQKWKATKTVVEDSRMVAEINELLEVIDVKEFGPGESPLRELAKIGYMLRSGATTQEIESLYDAQCFPALRAPQAQSALVRLVERQGHSALITEALTEETTQSEDVIAAKRILEYFGYISRRDRDNLENMVVTGKVDGKRPRGRSPIRWSDQIRTALDTKVHIALKVAKCRVKGTKSSERL